MSTAFLIAATFQHQLPLPQETCQREQSAVKSQLTNIARLIPRLCISVHAHEAKCIHNSAEVSLQNSASTSFMQFAVLMYLSTPYKLGLLLVLLVPLNCIISNSAC